MHKEHHAFLYGIIAAVSSSGTALFVKLSVSASVPMLVFARFALGLPLLIWMAYRSPIDFSWKRISKHLLRSLGSLTALYTYFYGVQMLPLVNAVTLTNTAPLFMPLIALIWLKIVVSKKRFLAAAVGFVGVVILLRPTSDFLEWGSLLALTSGLFAAISLLGVRQLSKIESTEMILFYYFSISTVLSFFPLLLDWRPVSEPKQWLYILLSGTCALVYQYTMTKAFTHAPATKVSTLNYLSVIFGGLFGWWIFGEVPDVWVLLGTGFILAGALLALFDSTPPRSLRDR